MHEIKLNELKDDAALTQAVVQITQLLGMYQAEAARVLGLQCEDIGAFATAKRLLQAGSPEWEKARQFVMMYERLYALFAGDSIAIYHWLRAQHAELGSTPLLLIVDEGKLTEVIGWLES